MLTTRTSPNMPQYNYNSKTTTNISLSTSLQSHTTLSSASPGSRSTTPRSTGRPGPYPLTPTNAKHISAQETIVHPSKPSQNETKHTAHRNPRNKFDLHQIPSHVDSTAYPHNPRPYRNSEHQLSPSSEQHHLQCPSNNPVANYTSSTLPKSLNLRHQNQNPIF